LLQNQGACHLNTSERPKSHGDSEQLVFWTDSEIAGKHENKEDQATLENSDASLARGERNIQPGIVRSILHERRKNRDDNKQKETPTEEQLAKFTKRFVWLERNQENLTDNGETKENSKGAVRPVTRVVSAVGQLSEDKHYHVADDLKYGVVEEHGVLSP
jgi:hypothetical protein